VAHPCTCISTQVSLVQRRVGYAGDLSPHVLTTCITLLIQDACRVVQVKMVMALTSTLTGVYTTDVNVNNVIAQSIAGVNAPSAPVQAVANPTLNNPSVSAPAISTTGSAIPGVR